MEEAQFASALQACMQDAKGKRKFTQAAELIINFNGIDFAKQDNRLNVDVVLPKGKGRDVKIGVFSDGGQISMEAKNAGFEVFTTADAQRLAGDRKALKEMVKKYEFLADPKMMVVVAKHLGQFLGTRERLPRPIVGAKMADIAERARKSVKLKSKGKYLPVAQCLIGTENMSADDLAENAYAVYDALKSKVGGDFFIRSMYVKLSMGRPVKVGEVKVEAAKVGA